MMNKTTLNIALSFLVFFLNYSGFAQSEILTDQEIIRLNNLLKEHARNSDSLTFYANELLRYSEENQLDYWKYHAYLALGNAKRSSGNIVGSNNDYHNALKIAIQLSDDHAKHSVMNNIAVNHKRLNLNDSAYYYFKKLDAYYSQQLELLPGSLAKMNLGLTFLQYKNLDSAAYYLKAANKGFKVLDNKRYIAQNQNLLGELQFQKENYDEAIKYVDSSLKLSDENNLKFLLPTNYNVLSRIYSQIGQKEKSIEYDILAKESKPRVRDFSDSRITTLNEDIKIKKAKLYESRLNEVEDTNQFFKLNLFLALLIIFILMFIAYKYFKKHESTKKEVKDVHQELKKIKESKNEVKAADEKVIHLKSKASFNSSNILYVKSDGHYVEYYLDSKNNPEVDRSTMIEVEKMLPTPSFVRIHKSYIVNINRIKIINSNKVMLDTGEWINLSRVYKDRLKNILHK
jgi:tetratricopeptide (TPR) repeat protein